MLRRARVSVASLIVCSSVLVGFFASAPPASAAPPSPERIDELLLELENHNLSRRSGARDTLLKMNHAYLIEHLIKSLDSPGGDFAAVRLLAEIGDDSIAPLIAVLERRAPLLDGWRQTLETTRTPPPFASVPMDEFADARCGAAMVLVALGKKPVPKLIITMRSSNAITRAYIAKILGKSGDSRAVSTLIKALGDETPAVRWNAAWSLGALGKPTAIRPLIAADAGMKAAGGAITSTTAPLSPAEPSPEALAAYADDIRVTIIDALSKFEDPRAFRHLSTSLGDASTHVRVAAARAIASSAVKRSGDLLIAALDDADKAVRAEAAFGLGDHRDERAAAELTAIVHGGYGNVARAARLLGVLEHKPAAAALVSAFSNSDSSARANAVEAVGILGAKQYVPQVAALLRDSSYRVRDNAILALEKLDPEEAAVKIAPLVKDPKMEPRAAAAKALGRLADKRAVDALVEALKDIRSDCRVEAAVSLGKIRDQQAVEPLIEILETSNNKTLHDACMAALVELASPKTTKLLLDLLTHRASNVRARAAESLARIADMKSFDALVNATKDEAPLVRKRALWALTSFPGPATIAIMVAALEDADAQVADAAQGALRKMADPRAIEPLSGILKTGTDDMRVRAAKVLGKIKEPEAVRPLIAALKDPIQAVRARAAWSLEDRGDPRAVAPLLPLLGDPFVEVRRAAAWVLVIHDDPAAVGALMRALDDPDPHVRRGAAACLGNIGGERAVTALISTLNDPVLDVRWDAALSLSLLKDPRAVEPLISAFHGKKGTEKGAILLALSAVDTPRAGNAVDSMLEDIDVKDYAANRARYITESWKRNIFGLSAALVLYGDYEMARDFRWSNNVHLKYMAYYWARPRGLEQKLRDSKPADNQPCWQEPGNDHLTTNVRRLNTSDPRNRKAGLRGIGFVFRGYAPRFGAPMLEESEPGPELAMFWNPLEPPVKEHKTAETMSQLIAMNMDDMGTTTWLRKETTRAEILNAFEAVAHILLNDTDATVRQKAAHTLARTHDPLAIEPLAKGLTDGVPAVRVQCALALAVIEANEVVDLLVTAVEDESDSVCWAALSSLGATQNPRAFDIILGFLENDPDPMVQAFAAGALGVTADERAIEPLRKALESPDLRVRGRAAASLGDLHDQASVATIAGLLYEDDLTVVTLAAAALSNIGTAAALSELDAACGNLTLKQARTRYADYIERGNEKDIKALIIAISTPGMRDALSDYYWSGQKELAEAALSRSSSSEEFFRIRYPDNFERPRWGSKKVVKKTLGKE